MSKSAYGIAGVAIAIAMATSGYALAIGITVAAAIVGIIAWRIVRDWRAISESA